MIFRNSWVLLALPVFYLLAFYQIRRHRRPGFIFPSGSIIKNLKRSIRSSLFQGMFYLRAVCITLVILAMARPQIGMGTKVRKEGIAIVIAIDCSSTMLAEDLKLSLTDFVKLSHVIGENTRINRIDAAREIVKEFISSRPDDMIGLVAFASQAFLVCPLTFDHDWLLRSLGRVKIGLIKDGTAIGSGILTSLNALKDVRAKSRIIILLTDGINNFGQISPLTAAKAARALGIKIYTVGVASDGRVPFPVEDDYGRVTYKQVIIEVNEKVLKEIANITGGDYFRVTDMESLRVSYKEIDRLEKTQIEEIGYEEYSDIFTIFLIPALGLLLVEIFISNTFLRKIP